MFCGKLWKMKKEQKWLEINILIMPIQYVEPIIITGDIIELVKNLEWMNYQ